jgi:antitoxin YefM
MRTVNFSDARRHLKEVLDRVVDDADITIITRRDADDVVLMSLSEYNSWKETEYLLASPANARHLRESLAQLNAGRVVYHDLIEPEAPPRVQEPRSEYKTARKKSKGRRGKKRG